MADNPITVPLPQDLPQNWTYGQTIGPQGTDVGLTQQHGYNYLMKQVNAAQQAAQELGAAFPDLYGKGEIVPVTGGGTGAEDAQNALNNLGAGVRPNLIVNHDFSINQRKWTASESTDGSTRIQDAWSLSYDPGAAWTAVALPDNGLSVECDAVGSNGLGCIISNVLECEMNGEYTISALVKIDDLPSGSLFVLQVANDTKYLYPAKSFGVNDVVVGEYSLYSFTFNFDNWEETDRKRIAIFNQHGPSKFSIKCAKIEEGSKQTLAYQKKDGTWDVLPQPNNWKQEMLSSCQRYLNVLNGYAWIGFGIIDNTSSGKNGQFFIPLPTTMRTTPALSGAFRIFNGTENLQVSNANIDGYGENGVKGSFEISYSSSFSEGDVVSLWLNEGEQLILTAEL